MAAPPGAGAGTPPCGGAGCGGGTGIGVGTVFTFVERPPIGFCVGSSAPAATGGVSGGGGGSMPIARIRALCVAACVFAHGKSGPEGKY